MEFNDNNRAIYLQIADAIADAIAAGTMLPDSRIPSVREYAARVMVNVNTVMRAYEQLAAAGIIYNRRGMGFYVAEGAAENIVAMRSGTDVPSAPAAARGPERARRHV